MLRVGVVSVVLCACSGSGSPQMVVQWHISSSIMVAVYKQQQEYNITQAAATYVYLLGAANYTRAWSSTSGGNSYM